MSPEWQFILLLLGAVCFFIAVFAHFVPARREPPAIWPYSGIWIPLGLLLWILVPLIQAADKL
jgi:heme/copper-type cytochrome/quinol oxidase subunit 3